ncbi:Hypothetical protein D9617_65g035110 [Elsinoe fawcettii]|nr:Hypothetical protein D9617_65g035110 [Elsinoe fawcettii]
MAKRLRDQGQEHGYKNIVPISSGTATRMQDRIAYAIMLLNNKTREIKFYTIQSRDATKRLHKGITVSFCRTVKKVYDIQDSVGHHSGNEQLYSCSPLDRLLFELLGFDFIPASGDRLYEVLDEYARDVVNDDEQRTQTCPDVKLQDSVLFRDMDTHQDIRERLLPYRDANLLLDLIQTYLTGNAESVRAAEEALQTMTSKLLHLDRQLFPEAAAQITDALEHLRKSLHRVRKLENFISKAKQNTRRVSEAKEAYTAQLRTHLRDLESIEGI